MKQNTPYRLTFRRAALAGMIVLLLNACSLSLLNIPDLFPPTATPSYSIPPTPTPYPQATITFNVTLPAPLLPNETVNLSVVDEVTGLAMNPANSPMTMVDVLHYTVTVPFAINSVVKYRYVRQSTLPVLEDDTLDRPVRYRMVYVNASGAVQDFVASWIDSPFSGSTGRVTGTVVDPAGAPLTNILVVLGGEQTLTDSTGTFVFDSVLPGTQNLVAYAMDGTYTTFQQGVTIAADKRTRPTATMTAAPLVSVVFTLIVPVGTSPTVPIRLAGNLLQLGNTFADLNGGLSTVATRMPAMTFMADGRYTLTLSLPAGADIHYKYTLGDGFWNAEHISGGAFVVRQLVVPQVSGPVMVSDMVATWQAGPSAPITFEVNVPANTPISDIVSIQFNPYGWTEPIPMWPLGGNRWAYTLYSPLNMLGSFEYRYCRNDQCEAAGDMQTMPGHSGHLVSTSLVAQDMQDTVTSWNWMQSFTADPVVGVTVAPRTNFWAGIEFQAGYDPTWQAWVPLALQDVKGRNSNWVVLTPTWTFNRITPPAFSPTPGTDPLWTDTVDTINRAHAGNLSVALFPSANFPGGMGKMGAWWDSAARDPDWWNTWFERYQAFAIYHADMAAKTGAQALILGGDWVAPALSNGNLLNGASSNVPADADARWANIITTVRQHYQGPLYWAMSYYGSLINYPTFLSQVDGIYVLWKAPLSTSAAPTVADMQTSAGQMMDTDLQPMALSLQKPLIIAAAYPSITGSATACIPDGQGGCLSWTSLNQPAADNPALTVNLSAQSQIVQALLGAINTRAWVGGFVSRGYYPPVALLDKSASIHGKPAEDVLWYWYPRLLGITR
jgi:hypothetical protein